MNCIMFSVLSKIKKYWFVIIFLLSIVIAFYLQNLAIPFFADDYVWIGRLSHKSIANDIVEWFSILDFSPTTCGRLTCHLGVQILLEFGELFFDFANTVLFLATIILMALYCFRHEYLSLGLPWLLLSVALLYLIPTAETLFYWGSGSANYLLSLFLIVIFLLFFEKDKAVCKWSMPLWLVYAFVCGWAHEIFSLPIASAVMVLFITRRKIFTISQKICALGVVLGAIALFFSPGSISRFLQQESGDSSMWHVILLHLIVGFKLFRDGRWLYVFLAILIYCALTDRQKLKSYL